jgi:hypothetical protein
MNTNDSKHEQRKIPFENFLCKTYLVRTRPYKKIKKNKKQNKEQVVNDSKKYINQKNQKSIFIYFICQFFTNISAHNLLLSNFKFSG